jgi:hypothetical protein
VERTHVEHGCLVRILQLLRRVRPGDPRAAVQGDDALGRRRARGGDRGGDEDELLDVVELQRLVRRALLRDRRRRLDAHLPAAQRAGDVARIDLDVVAEIDEPRE